MEFEDTTSTESIEDNEIIEDSETNKIDELSDKEFTEKFDNDTLDTDEVVKPDENEPRDLESIYKANLGTDKKLDDPMIIKVDGQVYELDSIDEIRNLVERGTGVTKKFQQLAEDRKALEKQLEELGQTPNVETVDDTADEVESIAQAILDSDYADNFTLDMKALDDGTKQLLGSNPEMLKGLSIDYESGLAQKIMPQVHKFMNVDGLSFEDAYVKAGRSYQSNTERQTQAKPKANMLKAEPKVGSKVSGELGRAAIDGMSDKEFNAYFANS